MCFYERALKFYRAALRQWKSKVFVMCRAGRRRSASLTYFSLRATGLSIRDAENAVRVAIFSVVTCGAFRLDGA